MTLNYITWTVNPAIYDGVLEIRWYGLLFAIGFALGYYIVNRMFRHEGKPAEWVDTLLIYLVIATLIGSRLGHCLFYQWDYYSQHPLDIFKVWEGGLASHGGTIGIIIAMWIYSRRVTHRSILWILDRICVPVALVGSLIRIGNLMNHELYGYATDLPWAFRFITNVPHWMAGAEPIFSAPSHPTQLYESLTYLTLFVILVAMYRHKAYRREGLLLGVFFIGTFLSRILIEMVKNATVFMGGIGESFKMGQLLSIPFVIAGIWLVICALRRPPVKE